MLPATTAFLAEHRAGRVEVLAERLVATILSANPGYVTRPVVPVDDLRASCLGNVARVLELLAVEVGAEPVAGPAQADPYDAARATGRRRAEQGLPLDDVLRSFRLGGRLIWQDLVEQAAADVAADDVREIGTALWGVVDQTSAAVAAAYHAVETASVRAHEQRRTALWEDLLAGRGVDLVFAAESARVLDLRATAPCVVVVADPATDAGAARRAESTLLAAGHPSSWVRRAVGLVGIVDVGGPGDRVAAGDVVPAPDLGSALRLLGPGAVGVSAVCAGFAEIEGAFRHALAARQIARSRGADVVAFDDALPDALVLASPDIALRLERRWLGPLLDLPTDEARALLETLEAWVRMGGSTTATAQALPCHRNTVLNRLRRIRQVTGGVVGATTPPVELSLALAAYRLRTQA